MKLKTGDKVRVIAGKDKGKEGKVLQVFPDLDRVVVEKVNLNKRHLRSQGSGQKGQIIEFPAPIHVSNLKLVSEKSGQTGRVGSKIITRDNQPKKIRVIRYKGESEDIE